MNKFIAFAFFAFCATVAHSQVLPIAGNVPYMSVLSPELIAQNLGSSAASASSSASASSANNGLISSRLVSPLAPASIAYNPWLSYGPLASPWIPQTWASPINAYGPGLI